MRWAVVSFRAPRSLAEALRRHAAETGRPTSETIRAALVAYLGADTVAGSTTAPTDAELVALLDTYTAR
jgi:hypothetical protein